MRPGEAQPLGMKVHLTPMDEGVNMPGEKYSRGKSERRLLALFSACARL